MLIWKKFIENRILKVLIGAKNNIIKEIITNALILGIKYTNDDINNTSTNIITIAKDFKREVGI